MKRLKQLTSACLLAGVIGVYSPTSWAAAPVFGPPLPSTGQRELALQQEVTYRNLRDRKGPWSIHIVEMPLGRKGIELATVHAGGRALGLTTLTRQIQRLGRTGDTPLAGINGDFYERRGSYAGDTRGLQILDGELISAPCGNGSFWVDATGALQVGEIESRFQVTWPDGTKNAFGLNSARRSSEIILYTPAVGASTGTSSGREFILERGEDNDWLPLRAGKTYRAVVREVRKSGDTQVAPGTMVLSVGSAMARKIPAVEPGDELVISTETSPSLRGTTAAISGGPLIVQDGKRQRIRSTSDSYESSSMTERHPRSAVGFNRDAVYLVQVDGRYRNVSVGMTLNELGAFMAQLGCEQALALDGGGSATLWYDGKVRNRPCDGYERSIANGLVVVKRTGAVRKAEPSALTESESEEAGPGEEIAFEE